MGWRVQEDKESKLRLPVRRLAPFTTEQYNPAAVTDGASQSVQIEAIERSENKVRII